MLNRIFLYLTRLTLLVARNDRHLFTRGGEGHFDWYETKDDLGTNRLKLGTYFLNLVTKQS